MWGWGLGLLVGLLLIVPTWAGDVNWESLFTGEVTVEPIERPDGVPGVRALFTVTAPREHIWKVLTDYPNFLKMFPDIHAMHVLAQDTQGATIAYEVRAFLSTYRYILQRHYTEPGRRLTWERLSGDVKRIEGSWEIRDTPRPAAQMLVYESYVEVGGVLPVAMVRAEGIRRARDMGAHLRQWIEEHR